MAWDGNETLGADGYAALVAQFERDEQMANRFYLKFYLNSNIILD